MPINWFIHKPGNCFVILVTCRYQILPLYWWWIQIEKLYWNESVEAFGCTYTFVVITPVSLWFPNLLSEARRGDPGHTSDGGCNLHFSSSLTNLSAKKKSKVFAMLFGRLPFLYIPDLYQSTRGVHSIFTSNLSVTMRN